MSYKIKTQVEDDETSKLTAKNLNSISGRPQYTLSWAKKVLKLYKAMTYFEKQKHMEPFFSKAFKEFAKIIYPEVKTGVADQLEKSVGETSLGMFDGLSMISQFKFSDNFDANSLNGSEGSVA